jgi:kynureninase
MRKGFKPMYGADGWQLSNAQIFAFAAHKASLQMFETAGIENLRVKSLKLTAFLEKVLLNANESKNLFRIITPSDPAQRGCQLSLLTDDRGKELFDFLSENGIMADWREPNVIRFAPVPMYTSFEDVWRVGEVIRREG